MGKTSLLKLRLGPCVELFFDGETGKPCKLYLIDNDAYAEVYESEGTEISTNVAQKNLMSFKLLLNWGEGYGLETKKVLYSIDDHCGNFIE